MSPVSPRRWPAEWERHSHTLLAWPVTGLDWPGKYEAFQHAFADLVRLIAEREQVLIAAASAKHSTAIRKLLIKAHADTSKVSFITQSLDRTWMRDESPVFVKNGDMTEAIHFRFNGWAKYPNHKRDQKLPAAVTKALRMERTEAMYNDRHVVLEGGGIDGNGKGTMLTTEECFLHPKVQVRNPGFTKDDYAAVFRDYLGVQNIIWLKNGIAGDDTHGHVDDLCRFIDERTIVLCREANVREKNYRALEENIERLADARLEDGSKPRIAYLPMPKPLYYDDLRLPASYANFIFVGDALFVPTFNDANDRIALGILAELMPARTVIGVHAIDIVWGLGTLHCLSHEIPA
ncbi:MAG: agmatine deiminase family protein [Spirochaetota bacterium]